MTTKNINNQKKAAISILKALVSARKESTGNYATIQKIWNVAVANINSDLSYNCSTSNGFLVIEYRNKYEFFNLEFPSQS